MPMGTAAMAYVVWTKFLRHDPADPSWINRDRFVLSAGHGSMLLYSLLHLTGYDLSIEDLQNFRQWESLTPGHPESNLTPGVEATTGPLGQGVGNIVGMAIARAHLAAMFNRTDHKLIDFRIFGICSDGDLMEGVSAEAASLAGHLGLGSIVLLYDDNHITIDGKTEATFTEDVEKRFEAYGWHVLRVDGLDAEAVEQAVNDGVEETARPTLICCRTTIGYGSPNRANSPKAHGSPLGEEEIALTKKVYGFPEDKKFYVPQEVVKHFRLALARGAEHSRAWENNLANAQSESPEFRRQWDDFWNRKLPQDWERKLPVWSPKDKPTATRKASELVINALAPVMPWLIGGSADLAASNLTYMAGQGDFQKGNALGRNLHFGIREHSMGAVLNGIALTAPFTAFGGTFLTFLDYMKPSVRLAALSHLPVIYVFTHDSIGVGEDGPTHQPIEHLWHMRATPNLFVFRPADANETALCWKLCIERRDGPSALALSRQNLPILAPEVYGKLQVERGAYILAEASKGDPQLILLATGSEVALALKARERLEQEGIATRVVSMPCVELFDQQDLEYRNKILPPLVKHRIAIEAGATSGWWKYVGLQGAVIGLDRFGASAPAEILFEKFGFTVDHVAERVKIIMKNG
jgi:transketolase